MTSTAPAPVRLRTAPTTFGGRLRGFGAAQPSGVLTGAQLGERVGRTAEWIQTRTGITELRTIGDGESLLELAVDAGRQAMSGSEDEIDLVIAATCSVRDGSVPLAPQITRELAPTAASMDLNSVCSGFCYSLATADALIRTGRARTVLIIGADHMTDLVDPLDLGTSIIFGDGAGAVLVTAAEQGRSAHRPGGVGQRRVAVGPHRDPARRALHGHGGAEGLPLGDRGDAAHRPPRPAGGPACR